MGPDEDHPNVDNNGFTNAAAKLAIGYKRNWKFIVCKDIIKKIRLPWQLWKRGLCGSNIPIWWLEVANGLVVEYDRFPNLELTHNLIPFLDTHVSLAPTHVCLSARPSVGPSVGQSVGHTFEFPFFQRPWLLDVKS